MRSARLIPAAFLLTLVWCSLAHAMAGLMVRCDQEADVYLNGVKIGVCPGRFTPKAGTYTLSLKKSINGVVIPFHEAALTLADNEIRKVDAAISGEMARGMVRLKGGCFQMGDTIGDGLSDERPVHEACVDSFALGSAEVTVAQFRAFAEDSGYVTDAEKNAGGEIGCWVLEQDSKGIWSGGYKRWANWRKPLQSDLQPLQDNHPVSCVSWNDAAAFAEWLAKKSGIKYRLPTEAEWEYAARGGAGTRNYWGDSKQDACLYANVTDQSPLPGGTFWPGDKHECSDGFPFASPVRHFKPNAFGLYDMMGNIWEWTADRYDGAYYKNSSRTNPQGPSSGTNRVLRGGSWSSNPAMVRSSGRRNNAPESRGNTLGFRLAVSAIQ